MVVVLGFASILDAQPVRINLEAVVTGLNQPVYFTNAHDGTNRRFIVEQPGRILVMQPNSTARAVFLDISSRVLAGGERGLLGLAFHPQFAVNRQFFVNYTRRPDGATVIARYFVSAADSNVADSPESVVLVIPQPFENHNGGMIEFGPDGYLYVGMGDGGSGNDPGNRAQNPDELLGKVLRIDINVAPYTSPPSNPLVSTRGRSEIFALGLRNPWRFSFDRATGQLYAGDVGQNEREEVDIITNGGNFGWRAVEGTRCTNLGPASCSTPGLIPPIAEYDHSTNGRCSITGGYVYRGSQQSLPYGAYVYGDYCSGEIFILQGGVASVLTDTSLNISSFGEDEAGEIFVVALGGTISRITNPDSRTTSALQFSIADRGGFSVSSAGQSSLTTGYSRIQVCCGRPLPEGMAIFGYRSGGVLVSEASVPAVPLTPSGRIFAEVGGAINTGLAIANPNAQSVTVDFYFTDSSGANSRQGSTTIGPNRQISAFLNEAPFNGAAGFQGTLTFTASALVSAVALRGVTNERNEFLIATLPVARLQSLGASQTLPHFADGGGWSTDFVLVNPTEQAISGSLQWLSSTGQPVTSFAAPDRYSIQPRSSFRFRTSGTGSGITVGSVRIVADDFKGSPGGHTFVGPYAMGIFAYRSTGVTVTQATVIADDGGDAYHMFVESRGALVQTGVALAGRTGSPATVNLQLFNMDGTPAGVATTLTIPANGHVAMFLSQIPGFASLPAPFSGVLRATGSGFSMTGLRGRYNERGEFIITANSPVNENSIQTSSELLFPHVAFGSGYEMQLVMVGGGFSQVTAGTAGTIYLFDRNGNPMTVTFR